MFIRFGIFNSNRLHLFLYICLSKISSSRPFRPDHETSSNFLKDSQILVNNINGTIARFCNHIYCIQSMKTRSVVLSLPNVRI